MSDTFQPQSRQQSRRRGPRSPSVSSVASDAEGPSRRRRRGGGGRRSSNLPPLSEQPFQPQQQQQQQNGMAPMQEIPPMQPPQPQSLVDRVPTSKDNPSGDDTLKLRLDLNLDVAIEVRARVHGDVTLSLLG